VNDSGRWWKEGVLYQIYPRSFADSNGDGVGDLSGIIDRLEYLEWLGIDGIWLNPIMSSPNDDWGYDVSDYTSVHPELGTLDDVDRLIAESGRRGIRVLLDFVPNHTSTQHPWFMDATSDRNAKHRDWYVWADPKADGSPPNNWLSFFGGSAWEFDESSGQYYLHNFLSTQADLNWWNEEVRDAMDDVLRFWYDRGVAGFRIDVAHAVIKDKELRDNLAATPDDDRRMRRLGQRPTYNMDRPEVHDVIRRWRKLGDSYDPPRVLVGETFLFDLARVAAYYGKGDELHLAFNFPFVFASFEARPMKEVVELTENLLPPIAWPVWTGSNHDVLRFPSRWCRGDPRKARVALMLLLTLRGTPFLYYGDEIGMLSTELRREDVKDPVGKRPWSEDIGRDPGRTPMHWSAEGGAGFTAPEVSPWLPLGDYRSTNVADQRDDPSSILSLTRALIRLRRASADLRSGGYDLLESAPSVWRFRRGAGTEIVLNFSADHVDVDGPAGVVRLTTSVGEEQSVVRGRLPLGPWEGAVVEAR
jgi:alpha-glucosidase